MSWCYFPGTIRVYVCMVAAGKGFLNTVAGAAVVSGNSLGGDVCVCRTQDVARPILLNKQCKQLGRENLNAVLRECVAAAALTDDVAWISAARVILRSLPVRYRQEADFNLQMVHRATHLHSCVHSYGRHRS